MSLARIAGLCCLVAASACGAPRVQTETHGVSVEAGPCGRGIVVVESDYQSSNVSLLDFDGHVLSPSLVSSNAEMTGFGVSLGSDAVPAWSMGSGPRIALIDRYPAGVLRFVELATGHLVAELPVGTGFRANPQDYLARNEHEAYVARYERNPNPGREAWDQGGDLLRVDPSTSRIIGRIDLSPALRGETSRFSAHPARLLEVGGRVFALLAAYADDYTQGGTSSRLVEIDPAGGELLTTLVLDGLRGCTSLALSPDRTELAVACSGADFASIPPQIAHSGLALIDIEGAPSSKRQFSAQSFGDSVLTAVEYAAPSALLVSSLGYRLNSGAVGALDGLFHLNTANAEVEPVLHSETQPFTLGGVRCAVECGVCFLADAERAGGSVLRFTVDASGIVGPVTTIRPDTAIGLPPRYLSVF